nr:7-deoxyloganetin glucosyltransferase-like [Coffea arabica]
MTNCNMHTVESVFFNSSAELSHSPQNVRAAVNVLSRASAGVPGTLLDEEDDPGASYLTNGYLDTILEWIIPGKEDIRLRDLPSFLRTTNPDDFMIKFILQETENAQRASAIILNTFEELKHDVISSLPAYLPPIYPIGLLHVLENLWKEEPECLEWLDSKEPNSVVYVNFGRITVVASEQLVEFAWAANKLFYGS